MPVNQIVDIQAQATETFTAAIVTQVFQATGAITKGMLVAIVTTETVTSPVKAKACPKTGSNLLVGVAANTAASGGLVTVITAGPALTKIKSKVTKLTFAIVDPTHTGIGKGLALLTTTKITVVIGKVIGVWMNTLTTLTGSTWLYVNKS